MPFIKKTDPQSSLPPIDARKIFIGRESELLFFVQNILKSADPTHNIISIWGQGGVGKSTLLARYIDETHAPEFKDYCLTAMVDERQTSPASMMEKFAEQLHLEGEFEKALKQYKEALRNLHTKREAMQDALLDKTPDFTGAAVEGIPIAGPILREGAKVIAGHLADKYRTSYMHKDAERLEDPIDDLTKAFMEELNRLADIQVVNSTRRTKRRRRVILFFDTFEQLAAEAAPWLLDYFLEGNISSNVVLIISGRDSIERSTPDDPKRWLPYLDSRTIHSISLDSFTLDETHAYLAEREITDPERIKTIWELSGGLPLYLGLLTSNTQGKVDPTADVVANFLRWIPEREQIKRQVSLDAALFSRPFNLDDLETLTYLPENERIAIYQWLIGQPFVRSQSARHTYHELAQELFSRHLYHRSQKAYYSTRRILASHYQEQLDAILTEGNEEVYKVNEWLELVLALIYQLFLLPDETSHIKAIEQILKADEHTSREQDGEITRVLRELSQAHSNNQANTDAHRAAKRTLEYIEAGWSSQESLNAANYLLEKMTHDPTFSLELLADIYYNRGQTYTSYLKNYRQAIQDFNRAIELDPKNTWAYEGRAKAYSALKEYRQAIQDLDRVLMLAPNHLRTYENRGVTFRLLKEYQQAIQDFSHLIGLSPKKPRAYVQRGIAHRQLKDYPRAIQDFVRALELDPTYAWAYGSRGQIYSALKEYERAIQDFDRALELDSELDWVYVERGEAYQELTNYPRAIQDFDRALELDPTYAWVYARRGQIYSALKEYERAIQDFDRALELNPHYTWAYVERSETYRFCKDYQRAILDCNQAQALDANYARIYAERGADYKGLKDYHQAIEDLNHAIELDPNYAWAYVQRGITHRELKDYQSTLQDINHALEIKTNYAWAFAQRGVTYRELKNHQQALQDFDCALELDPKDDWAYSQRGITYRDLKDYQHAAKDFDRALELDPTYAWVYAQRGETYRLCKEYERAIQDFDRALELNPHYTWAYAQRGSTYRDLRDYQRALQDFNRVLELAPSDVYAYLQRGMIHIGLKNWDLNPLKHTL